MQASRGLLADILGGRHPAAGKLGRLFLVCCIRDKWFTPFIMSYVLFIAEDGSSGVAPVLQECSTIKLHPAVVCVYVCVKCPQFPTTEVK